MSGGAKTVRRAVLACFLAAVGVVGLDGILFHSGLYTSILEPDSSAGLYQLILYREQDAQQRSGDSMVLTMGDSRFAYSPKLSNELTAKTGYVFRTAGMGGSELRAWYYMLRDLDPTANRYRAIVFGVNDYGDEDTLDYPDDDIRSLHYVISRLRWSDTLDFARSFRSPSVQWQAFRGAMLKGIVLQSDIQAFLTHPRKRIDYVKLCRHGYEDWTYNFVDVPTSMAGLTIDWPAMKASYPPGTTPGQIGSVQSWLLHPPSPQTGRTAAFRREWFGRMIDRYRGSRTKIIFVRLPRGPIPRAESLAQPTSHSIREFAGRPNVLLCDEDAFDSLERPELFKDAWHLNREGIALFSQMLAEEISRMLGPAK